MRQSGQTHPCQQLLSAAGFLALLSGVVSPGKVRAGLFVPHGSARAAETLHFLLNQIKPVYKKLQFPV